MDIKDRKEMDKALKTMPCAGNREDYRTWLKDFIIQDRTKLIESVIEIAEKKRKTIPTVHTPNCQRGTCKKNHAYCEISEEDDGYNDCIKDLQEALSKLKEQIWT